MIRLLPYNIEYSDGRKAIVNIACGEDKPPRDCVLMLQAIYQAESNGLRVRYVWQQGFPSNHFSRN